MKSENDIVIYFLDGNQITFEEFYELELIEFKRIRNSGYKIFLVIGSKILKEFIYLSLN